MATIIGYPVVLEQAKLAGLRCVYHNSGAFAFAAPDQAHSIGWIGPADETIRPEARPLMRTIPPPYEANLARRLVLAWEAIAPGAGAWILPTSHWAYELQFGSRQWMPALLEAIGIDPAMLAGRNQADAIAFEPPQRAMLEQFARTLLEKLLGSDFAILFPGLPVLVRLHHHKQVWWTTTSPQLLATIDQFT